MDEVPADAFLSDDALGWVYQFWQSAEKTRVNEEAKGGNRIPAKDIPAVTQLFTEPYMVAWLLDQSLTPTLNDLEKDLSQFTLLDPCCGSGHFLVAAFDRLTTARAERENLTLAEAGDKVLAENLFGLEIDPRCVQLAGFNVVFAAWKNGGYRRLPSLNLACSGLPAEGKPRDWSSMGEGDKTLESALWQLHAVFTRAPVLGSLIDPRENARFVPAPELMGVLDRTLEKFGGDADPVSAIVGNGARGILRAARILGGRYDLVVTNVPYLAGGKHNQALAEFCATNYKASRTDLATVFVERCLRYCKPGGQTSVVTPQNWLFQSAYKNLRESLLRSVTWVSVARLGEGGFTSAQAAGAFVVLLVFRNVLPSPESSIHGWDVSAARRPEDKAYALESSVPQRFLQRVQLMNPDARVSFETGQLESLLEKYSASYQGIKTGDDSRYRRNFWELSEHHPSWVRFQSTVEETSHFGGMQYIIDWRSSGKNMARLQGGKAWRKGGVAVSQMRELPVSIYSGAVFDSNMSPIIPKNSNHIPAVWCFCSSPEFNTAVRQIDQALKATNASLVKVPFDLVKWHKIADEKYPNGLPEPFSDDPTQWLFDGRPVTALARGGEPTLQVALARLLGYRWPDQKPDELDALTDEDGIVPLVPAAGEQPAHERLRDFLERALPNYSPALLERLLAEAGYSGKTLETYLQNGFLAAHCKLFHCRPFLWHIWDGRSDGFGAIVNYHKLDRERLEKLIYTYLGDYIRRQEDAAKLDEPGAGARLAAAEDLRTKLLLILKGEPPYDIYVRWKTLAQQPRGWEPDLNDGVRLNVRPFVTAGILRSKFAVKWDKDRGKNPDGSERVNELHYTLAEKQAARGK